MESSNKDLQLTQIRHKIDGLMDLLFGAGVASHHTIIEQINYLMFLRALTKRDDEAMKIDNADKLLFTGSFAKYRWDNLLMLNAEDLFTTLEKIYRELPNITPDSTVALLYRDAHVKIYEKPTLRRLLHEIEKLMSELETDAKQGSKDIFGDMYEYLLSKQSQAGTMGQFRTPRHIIRFITEIVDPSKNETILDPACGTAGFLVAAFQHLERKYTSEKFQEEGRFPMDLLEPSDRKFIYQHAFTGFDSDSDMIKFGLMNLYLHQLEHPQIIRQNTLVDTAGNRDKWNIILANPPFSGALDKDSISEDLRMGTRATEILFLRYMIDHLKENGRAGVIVPEGVIFSNSTAHKKIRQVLVDEAGLWCVVSLPAGIFNPYAGVKTSVLFFDKSLKGKAKDILFVKIENDGFDLGAQKRPIDKNDLPHAKEVIINYRLWLLANQKLSQNDFLHEPKVLLVSKQKIAEDGDYNLSGDRYKIENIITNSKWPTVELGTILDIFSGFAFDSKYFNESKGVPLVRIRNIKTNNTDTKFFGKYEDKYLIKNGDLLIGMDGEFNRTIWNGGDALLNQRVCRLENFRGMLKEFVFYMIEKPLKNIEDKTYAVTVKHISAQQIRKIKIPLPPLEIQQQIVEEIEKEREFIQENKKLIEIHEQKIKSKIAEVWGE